MSTSGTYTWSLNRDEIILRAYQEINTYGRDDTSVSANDLSFAVIKLNSMLQTWSIDDVKPSKRRRAYLFPALNTYQYAIGSLSGSAHCTTSYQSTTITTAAISGATSLTIGSTTGMTVADKIGIELDDGTRQWTTIATIPTSTTLTINVALTGAAAATNTVVTYTSLINKPLDILYGTTIDLKNSNSEVSIDPLSHNEYWKLPLKSSAGRPNNLYFDAVLSGAIPHTSNMYLYPAPADVHNIISFVYVDKIQDMSGATNDVDLPQEWLETIVFNLAAKLAFSSGKFVELDKIKPEADRLYTILKASFADKTPLKLKVRRY